jgi:hypothetical protein
MTSKTSIQSSAQNNLTHTTSQKESNRLNTYLIATEGTIEEKKALASSPYISLDLAQLLRYDEEAVVRQAIINNPSTPSLFMRPASNVAEILIKIEETVDLYIQLLKSTITTQSELYEDRTGDPSSQIAIVELNQKIAITTAEFTNEDIATKQPVTYKVWDLSKDMAKVKLETTNLNKAVSSAIYIIES